MVIGLSSGIRPRSGIACSGVLTTDILEIYPTSSSALPDGFAVHHALPTAPNTIRVVISIPGLAVGAVYSIPAAVYSINR